MRGELKATKTGIPKVLPIIPEIRNFLKGTGHPDFMFSKNGRPYSRRMLEKAWKRMVKQTNKVETRVDDVVARFDGLDRGDGVYDLPCHDRTELLACVPQHTLRIDYDVHRHNLPGA